MTFPGMPVMRLVRGAAILALAWGLAGCAKLPPAGPGISAAEEAGRSLLHEWLVASRRHDDLQGVAKIRVETAERSVSATQVLLVEMPDRLRAETLSPFGTLLLVMATDGASLGVLLPGDNLFYTGRATPENIRRFTRLPLHPADLVNILLARPPVIAHQQLAAYLLPDGSWRLDLASGPRGQQLVFTADRQLQEVRYLQNDELQLRVAYGEPGPEPQALPRRIEVELPRQKIRAGLDFSELVTGRRFQPGIFTMTPPAGATVVVLDEQAAAGEKPVATEVPAVPPELPQGEGK